MVLLTFGDTNQNAQGFRDDIPIDLIPEIVATLEHPSWWSGHVWMDDYRTQERWQMSTVIVVEADYHDATGEHAEAPPHAAAPLEDALLDSDLRATFAYMTPRGCRVAWVLVDPVTDPALAHQLHLGAAARLTAVLRGADVHAHTGKRKKDGKPGPVDGYAIDTQACFDTARLWWGPRGASRVAFLEPSPWPEDELLTNIEQSAGLLPGMRYDDDAIAAALYDQPCTGENDGSDALIRVCNRALRMGVETFDHFVRVVRRWNEKRWKDGEEPWEEAELQRRWDDALFRFEAEGRAAVLGGKLMRADLQVIMRDDREYKDRLQWDELDRVVRKDGSPIGDVELTWIEVDICRRYGYQDIGHEKLLQALKLAAMDCPVNRVTDYLSMLPDWDGCRRFTEAARRMRALDPGVELVGSYFGRTLTAAVARAMDPGCKHDHVLVLYGPDRSFKSTLFRVLAGDDNFRDTSFDVDNKDAFAQIAGAWIYEWSELDAYTRKHDQARTRNFLSSQVDYFRAPYDRVPVEHRRRGIIVGTSNDGDLLNDPQSSRRLWVVEVGRPIDIRWFIAQRDQLWAEALQRYAWFCADIEDGVDPQESRHKWWLNEGEEVERETANLRWMPDSPIAESVQTAVSAMTREPSFDGTIRSIDLYRRISLDPTRTSAFLKGEIARQMRALGFERERTRNLRFWRRTEG